MKTAKKLLSSLLVLFCLTAASLPALAEEKAINSIDVSVLLNENGTAEFTEVWTVEGPYDGTEYYIPLSNMKNMSVSGFSVTDNEGKVYQSVDSWDVDASFEEKAYKCGVIKNGNSYELCWGISRMEDISYTLTYRVEGLVRNYEDNDGFYYRFIPDQMSSPPQRVSVSIMADIPLNAENSGIWAFGYDGDIQFKDGMIYAESDSPLKSSQYVNILCGFEKGFFHSVNTKGSFEALKEKAVNENNVLRTVLITVGSIAAVFLVTGLIISLATRNLKLFDGTKVRRPKKKNIDANPSIPYHGSIAQTCSGLSQQYALTAFMLNPVAAYISKWELDGCISMEEIPGIKYTRRPPVLLLDSRPESGDKSELALYDMLKQAAAGNSLSIKQWEKWQQKNHKKMEKWDEQFTEQGEDELIRNSYAKEDSRGKLRATESGLERYEQAVGFVKYLQQFNHSDQISADRDMWGSYIVFASLLGITETVTNGLSDAYGDDFDSYCGSYGMDSYMFLYFMNSGNSYSQTVQSSLSGGSGGSAMSSGGGGFSGGGSGGGSR